MQSCGSKKKVKFDKKGWARYPKNKPRAFDMVIASDGLHQQLAWHTGTDWECGTWKIKKPITRWRKLPRGWSYYD